MKRDYIYETNKEFLKIEGHQIVEANKEDLKEFVQEQFDFLMNAIDNFKKDAPKRLERRLNDLAMGSSDRYYKQMYTAFMKAQEAVTDAYKSIP